MQFEIRLTRVSPDPFTADDVRDHIAGLARLDAAGRLVAAGPLADGSGGLVLADFDSAADAEAFARADPFVAHGYETCTVRPWVWANRENAYLGAPEEAPAGTPERAAPRFVPIALDKHAWQPSPLPGQIVLVTTVDEYGGVDVAPKSWVSMAAFGTPAATGTTTSGPVVGFGCNVEHLTYRNVRATDEFVVNVVPASLAPRVWALLGTHGAERTDGCGFRFAPATTVAPPVVLDCTAHLECRSHRTVEFDGGEVFVFGTIVAAALDERCLTGDVPARYRALDPCVFLEAGLYASLDAPRRVT